MAVIDENPPVNQSGDLSLQDEHPSDAPGENSAAGEAFTSRTDYTLKTCEFYMKKVVAPTGSSTARLYAATGTVGTNAEPTGAALASSATFDISTLSTSYGVIQFAFSSNFQIKTGVGYCIVFENPGGTSVDTSNYPVMGTGGSATHTAGNNTYYVNGAWAVDSNIRTIFSINGDPKGGTFGYFNV